MCHNSMNNFCWAVFNTCQSHLAKSYVLSMAMGKNSACCPVGSEPKEATPKRLARRRLRRRWQLIVPTSDHAWLPLRPTSLRIPLHLLRPHRHPRHEGEWVQLSTWVEDGRRQMSVPFRTWIETRRNERLRKLTESQPGENDIKMIYQCSKNMSPASSHRLCKTQQTWTTLVKSMARSQPFNSRPHRPNW